MAGAVGLFGGILGGIGEGLARRKERQDQMKQVAFQGALSRLAQIENSPDFSGDPQAIADLNNAAFQVIRDYTGHGEKAPRKPGGKPQAQDPLSHMQNLVGNIMTKAYTSRQQGLPQGAQPRLGPFLTEEEKEAIKQKQVEAAEKVKLDMERKYTRLKEQDAWDQSAKEAEDLGLKPGTPEYINFRTGRTLEAEKKASAIDASEKQEWTDAAGQPHLTYRDPHTMKTYEGQKEVDPQALGWKPGAPPKPVKETGLTGALGEMAKAHAILDDPNASATDKKAAREFLTKENRVPASADGGGPTPVIKAGTPDYKIAQDLAYGRLSFAQFRTLFAYSRDANKKAAIYEKASELNPAFDPAQFELGYRFASSPQTRRTLAAIDNLIETPGRNGRTAVQSLIDASDQAARTGTPLLNNAVLKGGILLGNKRYSNFNTARVAFADELSLALGIGNSTDMAKQMGFDMTDPKLSPEQFRDGIQEIVVPFLDRRKQSLIGQMGPYGPQQQQQGNSGGGAAPVGSTGGGAGGGEDREYNGHTYHRDKPGDPWKLVK